eukprot:366529-Chlamydomonas_euryale.AAC.7
MPTVDVDTFVLRYACVTELVRHLRAMGETNAGAQRMRALPRDVPLAAAAVYTALFGGEGNVARTAEQQGAACISGGGDGGGDGGAGADPAAAAEVAAGSTPPAPGGSGSIPATFQVMYLTGWSPHASQQRPKERGSATVSFQDLADGLVGEGAAGGSTGEGGDEDGGGGCAGGGGGGSDSASSGGRAGGSGGICQYYAKAAVVGRSVHTCRPHAHVWPIRRHGCGQHVFCAGALTQPCTAAPVHGCGQHAFCARACTQPCTAAPVHGCAGQRATWARHGCAGQRATWARHAHGCWPIAGTLRLSPYEDIARQRVRRAVSLAPHQDLSLMLCEDITGQRTRRAHFFDPLQGPLACGGVPTPNRLPTFPRQGPLSDLMAQEMVCDRPAALKRVRP